MEVYAQMTMNLDILAIVLLDLWETTANKVIHPFSNQQMTPVHKLN